MMYEDGFNIEEWKAKKLAERQETFAAQEGRYVIHLANSDKTPGKAIGMIHPCQLLLPARQAG